MAWASRAGKVVFVRTTSRKDAVRCARLMSQHPRPAVSLLFACALATVAARDARAQGCSPSTAESTCFDADTLAVPFAPGDFFAISRARAMAPASWAVGVDLTALHRPVVLHAPSPDPHGRDIPVVGTLLDAAVAVAGSPARHLELGAALPFSLYRTGTGLSGVTSQTGPELSGPALRDVRVGAGYDIFRVRPGGGTAVTSGLVRLELSVPTGKSGSFAGERSVVAEPTFDLDIEDGRFFAALEERVRLREPVTFGGDRLGTQWLSSLGVGYDALEHALLRVALEAHVAPYLSTRAHTLADGTRVDPGTLVPAEWMLSVRTRFDAFSLGLGGGTAIPLSSETRVAPGGTQTKETFAPVTTPEFRFALTLRYVLPGESSRHRAP